MHYEVFVSISYRRRTFHWGYFAKAVDLTILEIAAENRFVKVKRLLGIPGKIKISASLCHKFCFYVY
jgi:hypothetical protein